MFDWSHTYAPRALNRILAEGLLARAAREPFDVEVAGERIELGRGSVFVPLSRQDATPRAIHELMQTIAREDGVPVHPVASGLTPVVGRDLGAWNVFGTLQEPKIVLAFDGGLSRYDVGDVWWTLDYRQRMPATLVEKGDLDRIDWPDYTHLILVGGNAALEDDLSEEIEDWIRAGGTLIAMRQGARWVEREYFGDEVDAAAARRSEAADETDAAEPPLRLDVSEQDLREAEHVIGGAIFEGDLDPSHPMGFGYSDRVLPLHRNTTFTLVHPEGDPYGTPVQYVAEPLMAGYASERRIGEIAGTPAVATREHGRGQVILFADNPVFRGTYPGAEKVLLNAIFFSGFIESARGLYEEQNR